MNDPDAPPSPKIEARKAWMSLLAKAPDARLEALERDFVQRAEALSEELASAALAQAAATWMHLPMYSLEATFDTAEWGS
mgnify:CR=1 FL=1